MRRRVLIGAAAVAALAAAATATGTARGSMMDVPVQTVRWLGSRFDPERSRHQGPLEFYARAFVGYAAVNLALDGKLPRAEAVRIVDGLIAQQLSAASVAAFGEPLTRVQGRRVPLNAAYRGHLALLFEGRALLAPLDEPERSLASALDAGLAAEVLASPNHLLPSYGRHTYPADNEVISAALELASRRTHDASGEARAAAAMRGSLDALEQHQLPPSEVVYQSTRGVAPSRGCALGWTVVMRGLVDPPAAASLYQRFRGEFAVQRGPLLGFREYPAGAQRKGDADSGPIILGIGASATGLGLAAARIAGNADDAASLTRLARTVHWLSSELSPGQRAAAEAILLFARTARPWVEVASTSEPPSKAIRGA